MSVLSDVSLRAQLEAGRLIVDPLAGGAVQPSSIDLRVGDALISRDSTSIVDLERDESDLYCSHTVADDGRWVLWPGRVYLATTLEWIEIPIDLVGHLHGNSTLARAGITVHQQAGLLDPGYKGRPTLEFTVMYPTYLRPYQQAAQIELLRMTTAAEDPYSGRYQGASAPQPPRLKAGSDGAS